MRQSFSPTHHHCTKLNAIIVECKAIDNDNERIKILQPECGLATGKTQKFMDVNLVYLIC